MRPALAILLLVLVAGCNAGLEPPPPEPGIGGEILFVQNSWPPLDSLQGLWLFASKEYPLDSSRVITGVLLEPRFIYLYPSLSESLPFFIDRVRFVFPLEPGVYPYVGVIQQIRSELLVSNFRVVSVLSIPDNDTIPRTVSITDGRFVDGLTLQVDFDNPPPQPFQ